MERNLSVFLDALRLVASLLVFIAHAGAIFLMPLPDILGHSAKEGVVIFFVLSGFVIAFTSAQKEHTWQAFAEARASRMYSVLPLAITILVICNVIARIANPEIYDVDRVKIGGMIFGAKPDYYSILRYLTFTNELWFDRSIIVGGEPFWSLSYEVACYVAFAIFFYGRGMWRWVLISCCFLFFGPRVAQSFPLWGMGAVTWYLLPRIPEVSLKLGLLLLVLLTVLAVCIRKLWGYWAKPLFEWGYLSDILLSHGYYGLIGLWVVAMILIIQACTRHCSIWPRSTSRIIQYLAGASFSVYIMHLPIMLLIIALWPESVESLTGGIFASLVTLTATFFLAEFGERRKQNYKWFYTQVFGLFKVKPKMGA